MSNRTKKREVLMWEDQTAIIPTTNDASSSIQSLECDVCRGLCLEENERDRKLLVWYDPEADDLLCPRCFWRKSCDRVINENNYHTGYAMEECK
jgi:hypothetical protein